MDDFNIIFDATVEEADIKNVTTVVHGVILGVEMPFPLQNPDACLNSGITCPLENDTNYEYVQTLPVLKSYPKVNFRLTKFKHFIEWNCVCSIFFQGERYGQVGIERCWKQHNYNLRIHSGANRINNKRMPISLNSSRTANFNITWGQSFNLLTETNIDVLFYWIDVYCTHSLSQIKQIHYVSLNSNNNNKTKSKPSFLVIPLTISVDITFCL